MTVNELVKFASPENIEEASLVYRILEDNGDRVLVRLVTDLGLALPSIETYLKTDLTKFEN